MNDFLKTILTPLTTARPAGVASRDLVVVGGTALTIISALGLLEPEQIYKLRTLWEDPALWTALGAISTAAMSVYRILWKSSSDRGAEAAKESDKVVPKDDPVEIKTPPGQPDLIIPPDPK